MLFSPTVFNYWFAGQDDVPVDLETPRRFEKCFLRGNFSWFITYTTGKEVCRSSVVEEVSEKGKVTTKTGEYKLGTIHPDYQEFLESTRAGIPALKQWSITKKTGSYYITAEQIFPKKNLMAKIIRQNGNFLVIQKMEDSYDEELFEEEETVYVCWNSMESHMAMELFAKEQIADIKCFGEFLGICCKPVLML